MSIHYHRRRGPVCWEAPVVLRHTAEGFVEILLDSVLLWFWESVPGVSAGKQLVKLRQLTPAAAADLVAELVWRNENGYGQHVAIFGIPQTSVLGDPQVALAHFVKDELGPILRCDRTGGRFAERARIRDTRHQQRGRKIAGRAGHRNEHAKLQASLSATRSGVPRIVVRNRGLSEYSPAG